MRMTTFKMFFILSHCSFVVWRERKKESCKYSSGIYWPIVRSRKGDTDCK